MTWSIYKDTAGDIFQWEPCYVAWFFNEDSESTYAPNKVKFLHDGFHDVHFDKNSCICQVIDGRWAPDTEATILDMVSKTYHGDFIEGFHKRGGKIFVSIGS